MMSINNNTRSSSPRRRSCSPRRSVHRMRTFLKLLATFLALHSVVFLVLLDRVDDEQHKGNRSGIIRRGTLVTPLFWSTSSNGESEESIESTTRCVYEGHCGVGYTCVKSRQKNRRGGICRPYQDPQAVSLPYKDDNKVHACIQQCLHYTHWNEQFYYEAMPNVTRAEMALSDDDSTTGRRPPGCLLRYRRVFPGKPHDFSLETWQNETKDRRVVRVDPVGPNMTTATEQEWGAFCYSPCSTDNDCGPTDAFQCVDTTCKRRDTYWKQVEQASPDIARKMVVVSGATSSYFNGLQNLAGSLQYWAPGTGLVVFNLGMSSEQIREVENWPNVLLVKWKDGFPLHFPPHVRVGKKYAWKPLAINETLHEYRSIFWLDAGSTLVGPLDEVERIVHETGMFLVHGQDLDMKAKSSPLTYEYFGQDKTTFVGGPHFGGNTQAFMLPSRYVDSIVIRNAECALDARCIAPEGSSLSNHRYDQTTLSILAYMPHVFAPHHTEYLAGNKKQLSRDLHKPSGQFVAWTARQSCMVFVGDLKTRDNHDAKEKIERRSITASRATTN